MKPFEPNIFALATAKSLLLEPAGLSEEHLTRALAEIFQHQVNYADLYFQYSRFESWSLEEGIVKSGSFGIDQGVGVRAITGERQAFAYSDEISVEALLAAAQATRTIGRRGAGKAKINSIDARMVRGLYRPADPLLSLDSTEKVALLEKLEQFARKRDPRVTQVNATLVAEYDVVLIARSDGIMAADVRPLVRVSLSVIAEQAARREQGTSGGGGRFGYAYFTDEV